MVLTSKQIETYREEGYVAVLDVMSADEIAELREVTEAFVESSRAASESDDVFDLEPGHTSGSPRVRRLKEPHRIHPVYDAALRNEKVLSAVTTLLGADVRSRFISNKLNLKMPEYGSPVEWHQDWAFGASTNDDLLTVGIALDDMMLENGCLLVIPGSHRGPILNHHQGAEFVGAVTDADFDPQDAVPIEVPLGGISIHHIRTLHASAPNRSAMQRRLLLNLYAAADAWPLSGVQDFDAFDSQMVSGIPGDAPRLEQVPVRPAPRYDEQAFGKKPTLYDVQARLARSAFDRG